MLKNSIDCDMHIYASKYIRVWMLSISTQIMIKRRKENGNKENIFFIINPLDANVMA